MHRLRKCAPSPCDLLQIQSPARITRSALKKITFSLFNSQFLTFTATELIANPRCYKQSGKKAFSPYMFNTKVIDNIWNGRVKGPFWSGTGQIILQEKLGD